MPKTRRPAASNSPTDAEIWSVARAEAQQIKAQCDPAKVKLLMSKFMDNMAGFSTAEATAALCAALVSVLPGKDMGLRMNAASALLHDLLQARRELETATLH